jgi:AraC-like DNA-binding protein
MAFEKHGFNFRDLLSSIGIESDIMDSPDNSITDGQLFDILQKAASITGNDFFGLHAGEIFSGLSNILGYLLLNCANLKEAVEKYCCYQKVYDESNRIGLTFQDDFIIVRLTMADERHNLDRHVVDLRLAGTYKYCRVLTGKVQPLEEVRFQYKKPSDITEYLRVFKCPLRFGCNENSLVFKRRVLETPILQPNKDLRILFESYTRSVMDKQSADESYSRKVKTAILDHINGEVPNIGKISKVLNIGTRTLQLKLRDEGTTFSVLLDEIRKDLALEYLKNEENTIAEISYILGFSEPSVFHRCFKRWTNSTPNSYRSIAVAYQA